MSETPRVDHLIKEMRVDDQEYERKIISLARELETELLELTNIFELQRKRERPWIERWRKETGKELSVPDYGEFLRWLLEYVDKERIITGEQREIISGLQEEYRKLETTTIKLTQANIDLREELDQVDRERLDLKRELTHVRPQSANYQRVCQARGIDGDLLGHIHELERKYEKTIRELKEENEALKKDVDYAETELEGLEHHKTEIRY